MSTLCAKHWKVHGDAEWSSSTVWCPRGDCQCRKHHRWVCSAHQNEWLLGQPSSPDGQSRAVEQRDDKKPQLSDLRESGSIEQDADVVMFVFREQYYLEKQEPKPGTAEHVEWQEKMSQIHNEAEILIGKQRHGPTGVIKLEFESALCATACSQNEHASLQAIYSCHEHTPVPSKNERTLCWMSAQFFIIAIVKMWFFFMNSFLSRHSYSLAAHTQIVVLSNSVKRRICNQRHFVLNIELLYWVSKKSCPFLYSD